MRYRTATPADESALHALWAAAFPDPEPVAVLWGRDPGRHDRTFVAQDDGGRPVSVVHYLPVRSAQPAAVGSASAASAVSPRTPTRAAGATSAICLRRR